MKSFLPVILWINLLAFSNMGLMHAAWAVESTVVYDSEELRDPFVPLISSRRGEITGLYGVESVEDIQLEGVVYDPVAGSIAIANGVVLREKESRDDVEVVKIQRDGVTFRIKGQVQFKSLGTEEP